jgi:hypothetical protein
VAQSRFAVHGDSRSVRCDVRGRVRETAMNFLRRFFWRRRRATTLLTEHLRAFNAPRIYLKNVISKGGNEL